jgi:L-alanine-DL-glutamate epimerase-like enolase superfamily enzyme
MALTKPYTIAYSTFSDVSLAFFEVELANGMVGYGSGSPAGEVVGETTDQTVVNLKTEWVENFVGRDIRHFQKMIDEARQQFDHLPGTQAAIDIALHDAFGKFIGISVAEFYGQKIKALPTSITIGIKSVKETLEDAEEFLKLGFKILKVKMCLNVEEDIEKIIKLHEKYASNFIIRVDPNQGYSLADLNKFIVATKKLSVELIEQPLPVGKEVELLKVDPAYRSILMGDESLKDPQAALEYAISKPFGVYNIKLMKCGGIMGAMEIATIAKNAHINLFWGCNDESILSITAALHAAYCCRNTKYIDLDGSFDLAEDIVTGGFELKDGYMYINSQPGFGVSKL